MIAAYQNLKELDFDATFASHWASTIAESLNDEASWHWWVIAATNTRSSVVKNWWACRTQNETEKLAIAYEARAIEPVTISMNGYSCRPLGRTRRERTHLRSTHARRSANPGNGRLTLRLASVLHGNLTDARLGSPQ